MSDDSHRRHDHHRRRHDDTERVSSSNSSATRRNNKTISPDRNRDSYRSRYQSDLEGQESQARYYDNRRDRGRGRYYEQRDYEQCEPTNTNARRQSSSSKSYSYYGNDMKEDNDSTDSDSEEEKAKHQRKKAQEEAFDIKDYKMYFDRMFFRSTDLIRHGSPSYVDFWKFYDKIQLMRKKSGQKSNSTHAAASSEDSRLIRLNGGLTIPEKYTKKDSVPFKLKEVNPNEYIYRLNPGTCLRR